MSPTPYKAPGFAAPTVAPARLRKEVGRTLSQIAEQAAMLPEPYVRSLMPILREAQAEVTADLARWLSDHPTDGAERFTAQRYRAAIVQLRHVIDVLERQVPGAVEETLRLQSATAGTLAMAHLAQEVAAFATVFGESVRPIQLDQAAILARGKTILIPRFRNSANRYGKAMTDDFRRALALGTARGETFHELTERLVRHGGPRGIVALRGTLGDRNAYAEHIAEGLFNRYRPWAARIVRTEGLTAYNAHHLEALHAANDEDPGYMSRWDAAVDGRLCQLCRELDGAVVELGQAFPGTGGLKYPPRHPNCRCCLTPWRREWTD